MLRLTVPATAALIAADLGSCESEGFAPCIPDETFISYGVAAGVVSLLDALLLSSEEVRAPRYEFTARPKLEPSIAIGGGRRSLMLAGTF